MKKYILLCVFSVCVVLLMSCHKSKPEIVNDFIDAKNSYDTEKLSQYLTDDFMYYYDDTVSNISEYFPPTSRKHFVSIIIFTHIFFLFKRLFLSYF